MNNIKLFCAPVLIGFAVFLNISTGLCADTPAQTEGAKTQKNSIQDKQLPATPTIVYESSGKRFYDALRKDTDAKLIDNLGLYPRTKSEDDLVRYSYYYGGTPLVDPPIKVLRWEAILDEGEKAPRVLIFAKEHPIWPGSNITIVVVDGNFKVLSWTESDIRLTFKTATLQNTEAATILETQRLYRGSKEVFYERFKISDGKIEKLENFSTQR